MYLLVISPANFLPHFPHCEGVRRKKQLIHACLDYVCRVHCESPNRQGTDFFFAQAANATHHADAAFLTTNGAYDYIIYLSSTGVSVENTL